MTISRRHFVAWISSTIPLALVAHRADALATSWIIADEATMRALAEAILPSELGRAGAAQVAKDFQRWIDEYREGVELTHGYGTSALRFTKPSPRARWAAQLQELNASGFATQSLTARKTRVAASLKDVMQGRLPDVVDAQHVALALLAFYYGTPAASDLCYQAQIGRQQCRPLAQQARKPLPLMGNGS